MQATQKVLFRPHVHPFHDSGAGTASNRPGLADDADLSFICNVICWILLHPSLALKPLNYYVPAWALHPSPMPPCVCGKGLPQENAHARMCMCVRAHNITGVRQGRRDANASMQPQWNILDARSASVAMLGQADAILECVRCCGAQQCLATEDGRDAVEGAYQQEACQTGGWS